MADLRKQHQDLCYSIVHVIPKSMEQVAQQNFDRGVVSAIERILFFEEDLKQWKDDHK